MSSVKIRQALETKLASMTPAIDIAYENIDYVRIADKPFQIVTMLLAKPESTGYGNSPYIQRGYMQVALQYPTGAGPGAAQQRAELLRTTFYRGLSLVANGVTTVIDTTPQINSGAIQGDRFVINVNIYFYADIGV